MPDPNLDFGVLQEPRNEIGEIRDICEGAFALRVGPVASHDGECAGTMIPTTSCTEFGADRAEAR